MHELTLEGAYVQEISQMVCNYVYDFMTISYSIVISKIGLNPTKNIFSMTFFTTC